MKHFDRLWSRIFSSPAHLDTALSDLPPDYRSTIFQITTALLQRPHSLARYLQLKLSDHEPWSMGNADIADWRTIRVAADRLWGSLQKDKHLLENSLVKANDYPPYLQEAFVKTQGSSSGAALIGQALVQTAPVVIRVKRELDRQELLTMMKEVRIFPPSARLSHVSPTGIVIPQFTKVRHSQEFEKGFYEIQDDGSQFLAYFSLWPEVYGPLLTQRPGEAPKVVPPLPPAPKKNYVVVDACAGGGGKTLAMADALGGKGRVYAYDVSERKLLGLRQRAVRGDYQNIQTVALKEDSAEESLKRFRASADMVLVDAPCSGWGALRRNPDIKWRQTEDELVRLPELQLKLLNLYSTLVKSGGRLVYGICSFRQEETYAVVDEFLKSNPQFTLKQSGFLGPIGCDGFFMASLDKS